MLLMPSLLFSMMPPLSLMLIAGFAMPVDAAPLRYAFLSFIFHALRYAMIAILPLATLLYITAYVAICRYAIYDVDSVTLILMPRCHADVLFFDIFHGFFRRQMD